MWTCDLTCSEWSTVPVRFGMGLPQSLGNWFVRLHVETAPRCCSTIYGADKSPKDLETCQTRLFRVCWIPTVAAICTWAPLFRECYRASRIQFPADLEPFRCHQFEDYGILCKITPRYVIRDINLPMNQLDTEHSHIQRGGVLLFDLTDQLQQKLLVESYRRLGEVTSIAMDQLLRNVVSLDRFEQTGDYRYEYQSRCHCAPTRSSSESNMDPRFYHTPKANSCSKLHYPTRFDHSSWNT